MLNKKISCNGSRNCRGETDTGPPGMAGALGTAGYMALRDRSPHPRHQVPNTPALAAALLQLLDPLNVKLDVFLPKPGPACKGSGRIVVSPPLPQQQQQGGANLKKSTKASFFLRGVTPCRYRAKWTLLPAQAATGLWPNKAYQSSFLLKKKKKNMDQNASASFIDQLSLPSALFHQALHPSTSSSLASGGDAAPAGFQPGLGLPTACAVPSC